MMTFMASSQKPWLGNCHAIWNSYASLYLMPYTVHFLASGSFEWTSPLNQALWDWPGCPKSECANFTTEVGDGRVLSSTSYTANEDGSWEGHYFGANRYHMCHQNGTCAQAGTSTKCACYFLGSHGPGQPVILSNYQVAEPFNTSQLSHEEACRPFIKSCPVDNATAHRLYGAPFLEVYANCTADSESSSGDEWYLPMIALVLGIAFVALLLRKGLSKDVTASDHYYLITDDKKSAHIGRMSTEETDVPDTESLLSCAGSNENLIRLSGETSRS